MHSLTSEHVRLRCKSVCVQLSVRIPRCVRLALPCRNERVKLFRCKAIAAKAACTRQCSGSAVLRLQPSKAARALEFRWCSLWRPVRNRAVHTVGGTVNNVIKRSFQLFNIRPAALFTASVHNSVATIPESERRTKRTR